MYRRSALGSARFHTPQANTTSHHRNVSIPDSHPIFESVGLDDRALTQVRPLLNAHVGRRPGGLMCAPRDAVKRDVPAALLTQLVRIMAGQVQAPGRCRSAHI